MENKNMFETTNQIYSASHPTDPTTSEVLSAAARAELPVHFLQRATFPSPKKRLGEVENTSILW
jgi:precorrin-4 methylase